MTKIDLDLVWQQVRRLPTTAQEAGVLLRTGLAPVTRPQDTVRALVNMKQWGMLAGAIRIAAHRDPDGLGLVDELGELTFGELDHRSNALARAWQKDGLDDTSVIAVLCRDHRGLIETMFAAGKLGAKLLLMNTGFAKPQFAEVVEREGANILVYDVEFTEILDDVPADVPRYLAWTDDGGEQKHDHARVADRRHRRRSSPPAQDRRRTRPAHQRHDRHAERRIATGQFTVRRGTVPRPDPARHEGTHLLRRTAVPRHGLLAVPAHARARVDDDRRAASSTRARRSR